MEIAQFWELPVGARFNFRARRYEKIALSMARDEDRCGNVFHDTTEVSWDRREGEEGVEHGRPPARPWWSYMSPAPGQTEVRNAECGVRNEQRHLTPTPLPQRRGEAASCAECASGGVDSWK
jgi:hypothetical protein